MGILGPHFSPFLHFLSNQTGFSQMKISSRPAFPHSHHVQKTVEKQPENFTEFLTIKWQYSAKSRQSRQYSNIYNSRSRKKRTSMIQESSMFHRWNLVFPRRRSLESGTFQSGSSERVNEQWLME